MEHRTWQVLLCQVDVQIQCESDLRVALTVKKSYQIDTKAHLVWETPPATTHLYHCHLVHQHSLNVHRFHSL